MSPAHLPVGVDEVIGRLRDLQAELRRITIRDRAGPDSEAVTRSTVADTIYGLDAAVEPTVDSFFTEWARTTPLVLVAEGLHGDGPAEGVRVFPQGIAAETALLRVIMDPIDGTRGLMYDKRPAWSLAGVAPNRGPDTRLRDIVVSVMTELPTSKMGWSDVIWASRGGGVHGSRLDLHGGREAPLSLRPSTTTTINHGFATISNFFPGTKVLASELMEFLAANLIGPADVTRATVFDDQYISTAGQWYELMVGHDRFIADLRLAFYRIRGLPQGISCHPYDCAALVIAEEAGVILTDEAGQPLDGPLDVTTGLNWVGYANATLRQAIEPLVREFLETRLT